MRSSMFLNDITVIDHAFISPSGTLTGGSYNLQCLVSGEVDAKENVVVDFSTIKKDIKRLIDDEETGYDHKLWLPMDVEIDEIQDDYAGTVEIKTSAMKLIIPQTAIKLVSSMSNVDLEIEEYLENGLREIHPNVNIKVDVALNEGIHPNCKINSEHVILFRYTHGLKYSTSRGCQNLAHGHLSFAELNSRPGISKRELSQAYDHVYTVINQINRANLVWADNIKYHTAFNEIHMEYQTVRGNWTATFNPYEQKTVIFDKETTVENLTEWIVERLDVQMLKEYGIFGIFISEGLSKGAYVEF